MNNFVLPVVVSDVFLADIFNSLSTDKTMTLTIDLEAQTIKNNANGASESFDINPYKKECFVKGLDDIDYLLSKKAQIEAYEGTRTFIA